jgi:hypothetical protein
MTQTPTPITRARKPFAELVKTWHTEDLKEYRYALAHVVAIPEEEDDASPEERKREAERLAIVVAELDRRDY